MSDPDDLRAAAMRVSAEAETDDNFDGEYIAYLVPAEAMHALRAALAVTPPEPAGLDVERLRPWLRHHVWCNCKTDDPPATERCKCGLAAARLTEPRP